MFDRIFGLMLGHDTELLPRRQAETITFDREQGFIAERAVESSQGSIWERGYVPGRAPLDAQGAADGQTVAEEMHELLAKHARPGRGPDTSGGL